jgi:hypothetical protein
MNIERRKLRQLRNTKKLRKKIVQKRKEKRSFSTQRGPRLKSSSLRAFGPLIRIFDSAPKQL